MKFVSICILLFIVAVYADDAAKAAPAPVNFPEWFEGKWTVQYSTLGSTDGVLTHNDELAEYVLEKAGEGSEDALIGFYDIGGKRVFVRVRLGDESAGDIGEFFAGVGDEETNDIESVESWTPLFSFRFDRFDNGFAVSSGEWRSLSGTDGVYQFTITSKINFILTVKLSNSDDTLVLTGRKFVPVVEKTFLEKYGMMIGMLTFMMISQYMKYKMRPAQLEATAPEGGGVAHVKDD